MEKHPAIYARAAIFINRLRKERKMKKIVLKLTESQLVKLHKLYELNKLGQTRKPGIIIGHPDLNSMRIKFVAFQYWEYCILRAAILFISLLRGRLFEQRKNIDSHGFYTLLDEELSTECE